MNDIHLLEQALREAFPQAVITIDEPDKESGNWWLDVRHEGHHVSVEWRPGRGFGWYESKTVGYGEGPDKVFSTVAEVLTRAVEFLGGIVPAVK